LVEDLHIILDKKELLELFMQTAKLLGIERDDLELLMILCSDIEEHNYNDEALERAGKLVDSIRNILIP